MPELVTHELLEKAYTYDAYWGLIRQLMAQNKTTGADHSEAMLHYTKLNMQRMERQDAHLTLEPETIEVLKQVRARWVWLVLAEWWCGDVAQNLPAIAKMTEANPNISLRMVLRDEHPALMDQYLTNGGRSIPILICLTASGLRELGRWGPRPQPAQQMLLDYKKDPAGRTYGQFAEELHGWYAKDKNLTIQREFRELVMDWIHVEG